MSAPAHVQRVLMLAAVTGELLKRAQARDQEKSASASRVAELSRKAAQALAEHDRITSDQVEKVASALHSHDQALQLLAELAKHRNTHELGRPDNAVKAANAAPAPRTVVGAPIGNFDNTAHGDRFRLAMLGR